MKQGDVVRLKSGGPKMTVHSVGDFGFVSCMWFWEGQLHTGTFPPELLVKPPADILLGE